MKKFKNERKAMAAMTKRLQEYERVLENPTLLEKGDMLLKSCEICDFDKGGESDTCIDTCVISEACTSKDRQYAQRIMRGGRPSRMTLEEMVTVVRKHYNNLIKCLEENGYEYR